MIHFLVLFNRVNYTVTNARVGKEPTTISLTLEVWTDSGLDPQSAVAYSSKILRDQFAVFLNFEDKDEVVQNVEAAPVKTSSPTNSALLKPVSELELSCSVCKLSSKCQH